MLFQSAPSDAMGVRTAVLAALAATIALSPLGASADEVPRAGARCYGRSLPLGSNLPLGTSSSETDVVDIHVIRVPGKEQVAGWYYRTKRHDRFVQVAAEQQGAVSDLFAVSGAAGAATSVMGNRALAFIQVQRADALTFERFATPKHFLVNCFSRPLGTSVSISSLQEARYNRHR